ncbi:MAG TPA: hypothetical protein VNN24_02375 [Candidatus Binatus sp.]|nr:hypothetical protein [Candidatus Binatus sp.]
MTKTGPGKRVDVAPAATHGTIVAEQNPGVILLTAAKRQLMESNQNNFAA